MQNGIFKLDVASLGDAVLTAVVTAIIVAAVSLVSTTGFDVFTANWIMIGHNMANLAVIAGVMSLGKDFLSTSNGSLLGIGPTATPTPPQVQG